MSSSKNKIKLLWGKLGHPIFTVFGVISLGLGGAFVSSYSFEVSWGKVDSIATFIAFLLTNSYIWLIVGTLVYFSSEYIRYEETKEIHEKNALLDKKIEAGETALTDEKNKVSSLNKMINSNQENIQFLNNQIYDLQNKLAISWLKQAFKQHDINSTERASIYFELNKEFSLLARYSPNPELNEVHRQKFPLNQGVISYAWRHGSCIESECPKFENNLDEYYAYMHKKYNFSLAELKVFTMKSCSYVAVAICNVDDNIGVVVFESTNHDKLDLTKLNQLKDYCKSYESHLAAFIQESKALEVAKRMGSARTMSDPENDMLSSLAAVGGKS